MDPERSLTRSKDAWGLAKTQHGVVARRQLLALGFSEDAVRHRLLTGRLHRIRRGIYAVGREEVNPEGRWMAAVLACGDGAFVTHLSAGALYGICAERPGRIEVGVRDENGRRHPDIRARRRPALADREIGTARSIPVTSPVQTMIDLATAQGSRQLLRSVNEADKLDLIDAERLRRAIEDHSGEPGVRALRHLLDRDTFVLSNDELERLFLPLAFESGLPLPHTQAMVDGFEVDFFWPDLGLVVGLRPDSARPPVRSRAADPHPYLLCGGAGQPRPQPRWS